ncbi:MAG: type 4a pilus biogenesis protein PilO [Longimicrobiales bacterium]
MLGIPKDPAGQKRFLIGALPLLVAGAYFQFFHKKTAEEITTLNERYEELQTKNEVARTRSNPETIKSLQEKLVVYEQHMKRLEQLIPLREQVPELLYNVTERAQESGVDHALIKPEGEEPGEFYTQQTYTMQVIGSYHAIGRFFAQIGSLPRIITPTQVTIIVPGNAQLNRVQGLRLQADFKMQTYIIPVPDSLSAPPGTTPTQRTNAG